MTPEQGRKYLQLFKDDKSSWVDNHCKIPFQQIFVNWQGDLYNCWCEAWLPKPIGNILDIESWEHLNEFLDENNSVRQTILDRTYKYCNAKVCHPLQEKFEGTNPNYFVSLEEIKQQKLELLRIAMDHSCNLYCGSCRHDVIIKRQKDFVESLERKVNQINKVFFNPTRMKYVFIDGVGEFTASKTLFSWMQDIADSGIKFWLQSNGTLLYQYKDKMHKILNATDKINISIDAGSPEVFAATRRGGDWNKLIQGLEMLNEMRQDLKFRIRYNFTISHLNYFDLPNFLSLCEKMQPDATYVSKVERWGHLTDAQWQEMNIFSKTHPKHMEMAIMLNGIEWPENCNRNFYYKI